VVPGIYYQMLTVYAPCGAASFPVMYSLKTRKTCALYRAVFAAMHDLVPQFVPEYVIAGFDEASVTPFLLFRKYSAVSESLDAGFTTVRPS